MEKRSEITNDYLLGKGLWRVCGGKYIQNTDLRVTNAELGEKCRRMSEAYKNVEAIARRSSALSQGTERIAERIQ
jgi:hypothetical protein